ncbi:MAG: AAA family ATPase [Sulfuricurvum sp.]|uniref:AAA family ATPase n=1 Tax=Sulfuricurvum sp. TaxID=2025608 RepID=UPI002618F59D|nr:AAA family ATPase [Sulfuricurvum sp.]MDD5159279.1 AAA family ATPase [Sulfuricurvum sp.]
MQTLIGQIDRIIYQNNGFFIAALKSGDKISAHYYESDVDHLVNAAITLKGSWEEHRQHGRTFKAHSLIVNQNELFFFLNRVVKGFTKKLTAELIEKYGTDGLVDILDNDIERLLEIKGMNEKRLLKLSSGWKQFRSMRLLGEFLAPFGVTPALLRLIAGAMKEVKDPIEAIKHNPYGLMRINGIGFKKADEIALKMGLSVDDERRIQAAMEYTLSEYCEQEGNSCIERGALFSKLDLLLALGDHSRYDEALEDRLREGSITLLPSSKLSPTRIYEAETLLISEFKRRGKSKNEPLSDNLETFLKTHSLSLGEQQLTALERINQGCGLIFLVGYAGTGKSTTAKALLDLLATRYEPSLIMTCALSGIASQRIRERSGYQSATIQSLLVKFESHDKMPYQVVLIDEASMINSTLFARLMAKIERSATVIIVGDDAQLPPIGAGSPLSDAITLNLAPTVMLTQIYRQRDDQAIALIANDVRRGIIPQYRESYDDFTFVNVDIPNRYALKNSLSANEFEEVLKTHAHNILAAIAEVTLEYLPLSREKLQTKKLRDYLSAFQVISPMRGNTLGVDNLNTFLQDYFNPKAKKKINTFKGEFRLMDKVVHIKNENLPSTTPEEFKEGHEPSERRIFNGMCGLIFRLDEEEELCYVYYPNEEIIVHYKYEQISDFLNLSYALSVHKVQGMEYDTVVVVMSFSHHIMLNTKLLYTALTRAKEHCIIVGEGGAFESACRRLEQSKRSTVMQELN